MSMTMCDACQHKGIDRGRALDGRRAYRCQRCGNIWTNGRNGRTPRYSAQRPGYQFADTGAAKMDRTSPIRGLPKYMVDLLVSEEA